MTDHRITEIIKALERLRGGDYGVELPPMGDDQIGRLAKEVSSVHSYVKHQAESCKILSEIVGTINSGLTLDEVLSQAYESFRELIPYDRIGFALLDDDGWIVSRWSRSESSNIQIRKGYRASLKKSSLNRIIETAEPRILNDLEEYLREHPDSDSTKRIVDEGMRSSLTCPLIAKGRPMGVIFFSSMQTYTYADAHVETFRQIAGQLAVIAEKSMLYEKLRELSDLKSEFLGMAAHDIRNPLIVIQSYLEFFIEGSLGAISDEQRDCMQIMVRSCERMFNLVNDLLDITAIESGKLNLERQRIDVGSHLRAACVFNNFIAKTKSIELKEEIDADLPEVDLDPNRLNQVFNNLISNAVKFSLPNTTITVRAFLKEEELCVSIEDQGQGIPREEMSKLFTHFGKTTARPTANESSTGLGLAIVRRVVEAHGGKIWAESTLGVGSKFNFSIPLEQST